MAVGGSVSGSVIVTSDRNVVQQGKYNIQIDRAAGLAINDERRVERDDDPAQIRRNKMPPSPADLSAALERLINGTATDADLDLLRRAILGSGEGDIVRIGKYNIRIGQGQMFVTLSSARVRE